MYLMAHAVRHDIDGVVTWAECVAAGRTYVCFP